MLTDLIKDVIAVKYSTVFVCFCFFVLLSSHLLFRTSDYTFRLGSYVDAPAGVYSRESQGWTTACSSMPERDRKDQGKDSPK